MEKSNYEVYTVKISDLSNDKHIGIFRSTKSPKETYYLNRMNSVFVFRTIENAPVWVYYGTLDKFKQDYPDTTLDWIVY